MRTYTNLTWPDDPYRTGQQLYRRPAPRLAAFTAVQAGAGDPAAAAAIVYLPLHRTQAVLVTEQTLTFGFRAACADDQADIPALAAVADLDLMQARRHAAVLAGYQLAADLAILRRGGGAETLRGLAAVEREWTPRDQARGKAAMFDCAVDLPGKLPLEVACQQAGIEPVPGGSAPGGDQPAGWQAVQTVGRALMIALVCAHHQGRYEWAGTLRIGPIMVATAWDCLPWPGTPATPTAQDTNAPACAELPAASGSAK